VSVEVVQKDEIQTLSKGISGAGGDGFWFDLGGLRVSGNQNSIEQLALIAK
jgi:hypothetical protein